MKKVSSSNENTGLRMMYRYKQSLHNIYKMQGKFDALMKPISENKEIQAWWHFFLRTCMHDDESRPHFVALLQTLQGTHKGKFSVPSSPKDTQAQLHYMMDHFEARIFTNLGPI